MNVPFKLCSYYFEGAYFMGISRLICVGPLDCIAGHIVAVLGVTKSAQRDIREYYYHYRTAWWKWSEKWFHVKKF